MPKPAQTYRQIKKQDSIREKSGHHHRKAAVGSIDQWKQFDAVLKKTRIDAHRLGKIRQFLSQLKKGEPTSLEGKRFKIYINSLELVRDLASKHKELSIFDKNISKHSKAILRVPNSVWRKELTVLKENTATTRVPSSIGTNPAPHIPTLITASVALLIVIEGLLIKRRRQR